MNIYTYTQKEARDFLTWTSIHLSFAGRFQLINLAITSIANFWCLPLAKAMF